MKRWQRNLVIAVGAVALILAGVGFVVLDWAALHHRKKTTVIIPDAPPVASREEALV